MLVLTRQYLAARPAPPRSAHAAVHYPSDRRFHLWVRRSILIGIAVVVALLLAAAWIEYALAGLPHVPAVPPVYPNNFSGPRGFPLWVRYCHFFKMVKWIERIEFIRSEKRLGAGDQTAKNEVIWHESEGRSTTVNG